MPRVSIVIPAYNALPYFRDCLYSIYNQDSQDFEVIWVDSASTDNCVNEVRNMFSRTKIIELPENLGYRRSINRGAAEAKGKYLVICNQDIRVHKKWITQMVACAEADKFIGIVAPKILMFDDPGMINEAGNTLHYSGLYGSRGFGRQASEFNAMTQIATMSGCCFLIQNSIWRELGGFSNNFDRLDTGWHACFEDVDLAWRTQLVGYKVMFCPEAKMYHKYTPKGMIPERFCAFEWGRYLTIICNYEIKTLIILFPVLFALDMASWFYAIMRGKSWFLAKLRTMVWFAKNILELKNMRHNVQRLRLVPDSVIVKRMDSNIDIVHVLADNSFTRRLQKFGDKFFKLYHRVLIVMLDFLDRKDDDCSPIFRTR